jgi:hypothetical protein
MLKKILIVVAVAVVAFLAFVATRPADYHIERSLTIAAPVEVVHGITADIARFPSYSPWEKLDPNMKKTFSATTTEVGSSYAWESDKDEAGSGRMTTTTLVPNQSVQWKVEFLKPFESTATVGITTAADGAGTKATWGMEGHNNFMSKFFGLFFDMETMLGDNFTEGLDNLNKVAVEEAHKAAAAKAHEEAQAATPPAADAAAPAADAAAPAGG